MTLINLPAACLRLVILVGHTLVSLLATVGRIANFAVKVIWRGLTPPYYPARLAEQMLLIGWFSLPVVGLTAIFTGAALAQQTFTAGMRFNATATVPAIVVLGMVRELGPVLVGLMVAGRVSSAMAAEIGTMRVTEQLDAMATLRTDPLRYLIAPRLFAALIAMPLLVLIANAIGIFGGYLIAVYKLDFNAVGNHEFDRGRIELLRMQNGGCQQNTPRQPCARITFARIEICSSEW